ncbi:MAG: hypothetical protein IKS32_12520 [Solobacterium sp.]|nr:hypothetical protein [Solobacterium sp.]
MDIRMVNKIITGAADGKQYYRMCVPDDWAIVINTKKDVYKGYGNPFAVTIRVTSPDKRALIVYNSDYSFRDDYLKEYREFTVDDYGILHRKFHSPEALIDSIGHEAYRGNSNLTHMGTYCHPKFQEYEQSRYEKLREEIERDPMSVLERFAYKHVIQNYTFTLGSQLYRACYSGLVNAQMTAVWNTLPAFATQAIYNPVFASAMDMSFPYAQYSKELKTHIYTSSYGTDVDVSRQIACYAPTDLFDDLYSKAFRTTIYEGIYICPDLSDMMKEEQRLINEQNRLKRDQKKAERKKAEQEKTETAKQTSVNRTSSSKSGWLDSAAKKKELDRRARDAWSDAILGNTRCTDRNGQEVVVHSLDRHIFKRGDTVITSDSSWDRPWDFEELTPKK